MATAPLDLYRGRKAVLGRILKSVRRRRGLRPAQVAACMGMPLRSYEHFEGGNGRLNLDRIRQFAAATNSDPYGIVLGLILDAPELALRCMDNKLPTIAVMALQQFDARAGDDLARLDARTLIRAFEQLFAELTVEARRRGGFLDSWLGRRETPADAPADPEADRPAAGEDEDEAED
jgi:transcriptional regulator with XRE-family HTH domain